MKLSEYRKIKNLTQHELSMIVGVTPRTLISWEHGRRMPSKKSAKRIKDVFGLSSSEMWDMLYEDNPAER